MIEIKREPWWDYAACSDSHPDIFFPPKGNNGPQVRRAKLICSTCVARSACLEYALKHHLAHGIWGGLSVNERRLEIRRRRQVAA